MLLALKNRLAAASFLVLATIMCFPAGMGSQRPVPTAQILDIKSRDLVCLAENIYHESRGESFWGKVAVAQVTLNRVLHPTKFSNTICGVVYAPRQFSWTLNKRMRIRDSEAWRESLAIAQAVVSGTVIIPNFPALYFHTRQVKPLWRKQLQVVRPIGNHIFYH